jgi:mandelate racemase
MFAILLSGGRSGIALAGFDVACWDALSLAAGLPLASYIGSQPRPIPAYNSNGLGLMSPEQAADEAEALLEHGFRSVKLRPWGGRWRSRIWPAVVRARTHSPRRLCGLPADRRRAEDAGADRRELAGAPAMATALAADACDYVMPDLERIGGVTGWQRAAALASPAGIEISSHIFPEVSAHLLATTPTCHGLEYVDWAAPILAEPLRIVDGMAQVPDRPGSGVAWDTDAVKRYRIA